MPRAAFPPDHPFLPREEILSYEEISRLVRVFSRLGVRRIRLTGGEPLLRRDITTLIRQIREIESIEDISLTTNGLLLGDRAEDLAAAGLDRVTVSLDALTPGTFRRMSDTQLNVETILTAIEKARSAGLSPLKINCVVQAGVNEDEIIPLAGYFRSNPAILRFIEYMDVGNSNRWTPEDVVPAARIVEMIDSRWPLEPVDWDGGVARRYRYRDGGGEIGIIASVTQPFCSSCTRARLSSEGRLFTCLFASDGHDLRQLLRAGASDEELEKRIAGIWGARDDRYSELRFSDQPGARRVEMSHIGG